MQSKVTQRHDKNASFLVALLDAADIHDAATTTLELMLLQLTVQQLAGQVDQEMGRAQKFQYKQ